MDEKPFSKIAAESLGIRMSRSEVILALFKTIIREMKLAEPAPHIEPAMTVLCLMAVSAHNYFLSSIFNQ